MADEFDAIRQNRRKRGEQARKNVKERVYSPQKAKQEDDEFASVRNRPAIAPPPPVDFVGGATRAVEGIRNFKSPTIQKQDKSTNNKELPGRDIPVIGPVLRGLDFASKKLEPVSNLLGQFYTPGAGLSNVAGFTQSVGSALGRVAPKIAFGSGLGSAAARESIKEGITGVPLGFGQSLANNPSDIKEAMKQGAIGGALGGVGGTVAPALGKIFSNVFKRNVIPEQQAQETLALPMGRQDAARMRSVNAPGTDPIVTPYTFGLPEGNTAAPTGRLGEVAPPVERVGRAPGVSQPEVLNSGLAPERPRIDVTPKKDPVGAFNNGSGDASTFDQKINRTVTKKNSPFSQRWEKIRTQFVDDMAPLQGVEKRIKGGVASAEESLYKSSRLFKGTPEKANQIVRDRLSPVVTSIEKSGNTADDLGRYALAVHAKDVNAAGYKSGFTNSEIDDVIRKYGTPEMETARQQLVQINNDMLKELVDTGVVSRELADVLNERWKNYIPLFRSFDDDMVGFSGGLSGALANVASPIKALKGSERAVIDPLENMVKNIFQSVNASERNKVATQLANLAKSDKDGQFIRQLGPDEQVGRKNVVNVKVNGENAKYEVEPEVYKAMLNLDQESSNMLMNILSKPASLLRAGATLTPEFSLRNPMRDVLQAFVTSKSGFNPITDFTVGLIQSIKKGNLYKDWVDNLGAYGNIISQDRDVHRQALEKVLKQPASKKFVNIINGKGLINILRAISDTTESATKVGEYRAALRQGQTKAEAAYRSRDLMDFGRAGSSVRQANKVVAFLNANIQGKSKLIRAIKENPVGTLTRAFTAVTLPTIGIYALNHAYANETQKETIKEAPDWQKDSFWLMAVPGTDMVARIPKPFDLAAIFSNLPEKAMQFTMENDPQAFDGFVQRTLKSGALPAQISGLLPLVEGMANYSFFREGDVIPMREQNLEFKDQYDPVRTTETAKLLASGMGKLTGGKGAFKNFSSPRIMDNTIKGLTAGLGTYATDAIDSLLQGKIPFTGIKAAPSLIDRPAAPSKRVEQQPLAKAFLIDPLQGGKSMDTFYQNREKLQKQKSSASVNERAFTQEPLLGYLNDVSDAMSDINKEIRYIERSDLQAKDKRQQIEPLIEQRNKLAKDAVKAGDLR
jgi:hypothetical protein